MIKLYQILLISILASCKASKDLQTIKERGKLIVLTLNSPTSYYEDRDGQIKGIEFDLINIYAKYLGVRPKFKIKDSLSELLKALKSNQGDLAAAGLTRTPGRESQFLFGPDYQSIQQEVVCHKKFIVNKMEHLLNRNILVVTGSSYEERLKQLKKKWPKLNWKTWKTTHELSTEQILQKVNRGKQDCAIGDSNIVAIHRRYLQNLRVNMGLGDKENLTWILPRSHQALAESIHEWFNNSLNSNDLAAVIDSYLGFVEDYDSYDLHVFRKRIKERLPKYKKLFQKTAKEFNFPWRFLAAVSYQESHWDPKAVSHTGVQGLMMLTKNTAQSMGVTDRTDPTQSVRGGAAYLKKSH